MGAKDTDAQDINGDCLATEWLELDRSQRNAVAAELERKYDNLVPNSQPTPHVIRNAQGDVVEIDFQASSLDARGGAHKIQLVEDSSAPASKGKHSVSVYGLPNEYDGSGVWHAQVKPDPTIQYDSATGRRVSQNIIRADGSIHREFDPPTGAVPFHDQIGLKSQDEKRADGSTYHKEFDPRTGFPKSVDIKFATGTTAHLDYTFDNPSDPRSGKLAGGFKHTDGSIQQREFRFGKAESADKH